MNAIQLLRSEWLVREDVLEHYTDIANKFLAGKILSTGFFSQLQLPDVPSNMALIPINGLMTKADTCGNPGTATIANQIALAASDKAKDSILLYFENVPGGQVDGTEHLANTIATAKSNKPVIAIISGMACSAGVWAASQCSEVYATSQTDQVGCIGVVCKLNKSADKGVEYVYSDLSPNKNAEFRDTNLLKENYLNPVAQLFQSQVIAGRGGKIKADSPILSGNTLIAAQAQKQGLIDGVLPFAQIVKRANYLSKKNKMEGTATAFNKTLVTAKADAFAVTDEGFALSEDALRNIETALIHAEDTQAQLTAANEQLTALSSQAQIAATTIADLQAEVARLKEAPAAVAPDPSLVADPTKAENKYHTAYDDEKAKLKAKYGV